MVTLFAVFNLFFRNMIVFVHLDYIIVFIRHVIMLISATNVPILLLFFMIIAGIDAGIRSITLIQVDRFLLLRKTTLWSFIVRCTCRAIYITLPEFIFPCLRWAVWKIKFYFFHKSKKTNNFFWFPLTAA